MTRICPGDEGRSDTSRLSLMPLKGEEQVVLPLLTAAGGKAKGTILDHGGCMLGMVGQKMEQPRPQAYGEAPSPLRTSSLLKCSQQQRQSLLLVSHCCPGLLAGQLCSGTNSKQPQLGAEGSGLGWGRQLRSFSRGTVTPRKGLQMSESGPRASPLGLLVLIRRPRK